MSLVVSDIVLKNKFAIKRYETTVHMQYLNEINENSDLIDKIFLCETLRFLFTRPVFHGGGNARFSVSWKIEHE